MKKTLNLVETFAMIEYVYSTVFTVNDTTGKLEYIPELFDYAYRSSILKFYYNKDMSNMNHEEIYQAAMALNMSSVKHDVNYSQLTGIYKSICEKINYKKEELQKENITVVSELDSIIPFLNDILITINDKLQKLDMKKLNKNLGSLNIKNLLNEYLKTDRYSGHTAEIIDYKNEKIKELKKELEKKSK